MFPVYWKTGKNPARDISWPGALTRNLKVKNPHGPKAKNPKGAGEEAISKEPKSEPSTKSKTKQAVIVRGLEEHPDKTLVRVVNREREQRFTFDHHIRRTVPRPTYPVAHFSQKSIKTSATHENSLWDLLFIPQLRRFNVQVSNGESRMAELEYLRPLDNPMSSWPDAYLLISICKKPSVLPVKESHPRNLRILLNDHMVQEIVPSDSKPYPHIPLEIPISALQEKNVFHIYWLESAAEEQAVQDYYLYIYIAERKSVQAVVASIETSVLTAAESLALEYDRGKDSDITAGPRTLHLNDPISRQRIVLPVRGKHCRHLQCFDAASFVSMNFGPAARFLCPLCAQIVLPQDLVVDQFFLGLLRLTTGDRIELLPDDKGVTVREPVLNSGGMKNNESIAVLDSP